MSALFDKRDNAHRHAVQQADTLSSLAAHYRTQGADYATDLSAEQIAAFNWATTDPAEIKRALFERVGSASAAALTDASAFADLVLDPAFGPAGAKEVLIPKLWKPAALALEQTHTVKLQPRKAAVALGIRSLDKWFIPDLETCALGYRTEGRASEADQVELEVHASNYCEMAAWNEGLPTFTALADVPVFKSPLTGALSAARQDHRLDTWDGKTNCTQGLLAPGPAGRPRHLNAAFSPYTMALRYRKGAGADASDKTARIDLAPFWLEFDAVTNLPTADSKKIRWTVKGTGRLTLGLLVVVDKDGAPVYTKGLDASVLAQDALQEFDWSGQHADGTAATAARMPYRVRVEAHTDIDVDEGLALAAMHTEVRLFVHPNTHLPSLDPYVADTDEPSLTFSIADHWHKDADPTEGDGSLWTKWELARAGFHPGPVRDAAITPEFEIALREFQRSVPKWPQRVSNLGERLTLTTGQDNAETKAALKHLEKARRRPVFGRPADRSSYTDTFDAQGKVTAEARDDAGFKTLLNDRAGRLVAWVDDRNWYSRLQDPSPPELVNDLYSKPWAVGNARGTFFDDDTRVDTDANDVARPWIPLQVDLGLVGKAQSLTDLVTLPTEASTAARWRRLVGPLRVDWTFDEIETTAAVNTTSTGAPTIVNLPLLDAEIEANLSALYDRERTRSRVALRWALDNLKSPAHARLDVHRNAVYYNCPATSGGIRPAALATYYTQAIAHEAQSLLPWKAKADPGREAILTVVHDNLGQPAADLHAKRRGRAGVYFNPSRIAGDGYQVRAQLVFETSGDWTFPNAAVLKKRYVKLPQAHTAKVRLWRKTSIRTHVCWGPTNTWAAPGAGRAGFPPLGPDGFRRYYTSGHLHIENELGRVNASATVDAVNLLRPSDYTAMVKALLPAGDMRRKHLNWVQLSSRLWPWAQHGQFGVPQHSTAVGMQDGYNDLKARFIDPIEIDYCMRIGGELVRAAEVSFGTMRGHVLVEFQSTDPCYMQRYQCKRCEGLFTLMQRDGTDRLGHKCPTAGCGDRFLSPGKLRSKPDWRGHYSCANAHAASGDEATAAGGRYVGQACPEPGCGQPLVTATVSRQRYRCSSCKFESLFPELGGAGNSHQNAACPCTPCTGTMRARPDARTNGPHVDVRAALAADEIRWESGGVYTPGLNTSSIGLPLGVAMNFLGDSDLWAHELAHNRYHKHAGNVIGGNAALHDTANNTTVNWAGLLPTAEADPNCMNWDRNCLMTYGTDMPTFDGVRDRVCFCHKCVLRTRGWKLAAVNNPPADVLDP